MSNPWKQNSSLLKGSTTTISNFLSSSISCLDENDELRDMLKSELFVDSNEQVDDERLAWRYICVSLFSVTLERESDYCWKDFTIISMEWNVSGIDELSRITEVAISELMHTHEPREFRELLPHILDRFGPTSRLDIIRDNSLKENRVSRKKQAFFTTPEDVCEFIVNQVADKTNLSLEKCKIFDPAVGSGIFLRTCLRWVRENSNIDDVKKALEWTRKHLFGMDLDPLMTESATLTLISEIVCNVPELGLDIMELWNSVQMNIISGDSLTISSIDGQASSMFWEDDGIYELKQLFPGCEDGFDVIIGNPPYSSICEVSSSYHSRPGLGLTASTNSSVVFTEMLWLLSKPDAVGAMVLPLSIGVNSNEAYRVLRTQIQELDCDWWFSFFDREPCALFGEDVKTRNIIAIMKKHPNSINESHIYTTELKRFTSRSRAQMFKTLNYHLLSPTSIVDYIPKVGNKHQENVMRIFDSYTPKLLESAPRRMIRSSTLTDFIDENNEDISGEATIETTPSNMIPVDVFVGGVAYNYLNVMVRDERNKPLLEDHVNTGNLTLTSSKLHCIKATEKDAMALFAIFSSHSVFQFWNTSGDGFHVNRSFIQKIPVMLDLINEKQLGELNRLGNELWEVICQEPVISVNRSKVSLSFRPHKAYHIRQEIDRIILTSMGLKENQIDDTLRALIKTQNDRVVVDWNDPSRRKFSYNQPLSKETHQEAVL